MYGCFGRTYLYSSSDRVVVSPLRHGSEISDVNDLLGANESTRVFVALGACSVAQSASNESSERRHLARPVGEYRSVGEKPCRTTSAGTPKGS